MAAAMQGSAEFFAPETRIVPMSGLPPRMTNLSMNIERLLSFQCKSVRFAGQGSRTILVTRE